MYPGMKFKIYLPIESMIICIENNHCNQVYVIYTPQVYNVTTGGPNSNNVMESNLCTIKKNLQTRDVDPSTGVVGCSVLCFSPRPPCMWLHAASDRRLTTCVEYCWWTQQLAIDTSSSK